MTIRTIYKLMSGTEEDQKLAFEFMKADKDLFNRVLALHSLIGNVNFKNEVKFKEITGSSINEWWYPMDDIVAFDQNWLLDTIKQILEEDDKL